MNCYLLFDPHLMNKVEFSKTLYYFPVKSIIYIVQLELLAPLAPSVWCLALLSYGSC